MTSPPGKVDSSSLSSQNNTQSLPQQPQPSPTPQSSASTKPPSVKKPRQKKQAEQKSRPSAAPQAQAQAQRTAVHQQCMFTFYHLINFFTVPITHQEFQAPQELQIQQFTPAVVVHRGPALQPYPGTPYHIMNPPYPMNGSPYAQQSQPHPGYPPHPSPTPMNGASGPGIPGPPPPQYAYSMHHSPYPHGYAAYPQYPQQMMMYPPQRANPPPPQEAPQSTPSTVSPVTPTSAPTTGKRKRKSDVGRGKGEKDDDEAGASGSDLGRSQSNAQAQAQAVIDMKKRTKTQRACDSCRSRKIRCDILPEADPPTCQHCKQYGFECTFFLPITETRFKKKKVEEDVAEKDKADPVRATASPHVDTHVKNDVKIFGEAIPNILVKMRLIRAQVRRPQPTSCILKAPSHRESTNNMTCVTTIRGR
jgi:hypothetical protein